MNPQKTVIITGGTRGLGRAAAAFLLDAGWQVALNYVESIDAAKALEESYGDRLLAFRGSIASEEDNQRFLEAVLNRFGCIDALVNNAGLSLNGLLTDNSSQEIRNLVETNILGTLSLTRLAIPELLKSKGVIINISSIWGLKGASCETAYAMTKGALQQLTTSLARELGPSGVRTIAVAPGLIGTEMNEGLEVEDFIRDIPLGRMGTPEEVARLIAFLLESTYINGATFVIDGGYAM